MNSNFLYVCPNCRGELKQETSDLLVCVAEDLHFERLEGIWRFMLPERRTHYAQFVSEYEAVRKGEKRGAESAAYYRALPYQDLNGRMSDDWRIRAVSFDTFSQNVLVPLEKQISQPINILDLGAGNCWLSNRLASRGHSVTAVDLTVNEFDGLGCYRMYDSLFTPIESEFDRLPIPNGCIDLVVFNASLHYTEDYHATLSESLRVLNPGGRLVIFDSPIYHKADSGRLMVVEREAEFIKRFGFPSNALKSENYLTYERISKLGDSLGLSWELITPHYGIRWSLRPLKARLLGKREPARFQIMVGQRTTT